MADTMDHQVKRCHLRHLKEVSDVKICEILFTEILIFSAPGAVASFEAHPLGSSAFHLKWQKPLQTNGILTGYRIYYQTVTGTKVGPLIERRPITDPKVLHAKLAGLEPNTKYRIHIKATTRAGEGNGYIKSQEILKYCPYHNDVAASLWKPAQQLPVEKCQTHLALDGTTCPLTTG
jgi:hypothetical protein